MKSAKELARKEISRLAPYVAGKPIAQVKRELGLTDVIKLASNENPLGPSPKALSAMMEAAKEGHIYPDPTAFTLKEALAAKFGVRPEQLIIGDGSDELIMLIGQTFINPGDECVMPAPSFPIYALSSDLMGGKTIKVPLRDGWVDLEAMLAAVTERTKVFFLCNPNNPTGTMVGRAALDDCIKRLPEDVIIVLDEAYSEYVEGDDYPDSLRYLRDGRMVFILRTFSKIYGLAGLRVGYGIGPADAIDLVNRPRLSFNVNSLAMAAAVAALGDAEHVAASRKMNHEGKLYLYGEFDRLGLHYLPTETNFILVDIRRDSNEVFLELQKRGVIVRPAHLFGYQGWQRITIGTPAENKRLIEALTEVIKTR